MRQLGGPSPSRVGPSRLGPDSEHQPGRVFEQLIQTTVWGGRDPPRRVGRVWRTGAGGWS